MLDRETKARIADYFDADRLIDFLQIPVDEIVEIFEDEIEAVLDEIEEEMGMNDGT